MVSPFQYVDRSMIDNCKTLNYRLIWAFSACVFLLLFRSSASSFTDLIFDWGFEYSFNSSESSTQWRMCFHIESATFLFFFDFCLSFDFFTLSRNLSLERFFFPNYQRIQLDTSMYTHIYLYVKRHIHFALLMVVVVFIDQMLLIYSKTLTIPWHQTTPIDLYRQHGKWIRNKIEQITFG